MKSSPAEMCVETKAAAKNEEKDKHILELESTTSTICLWKHEKRESPIGLNCARGLYTVMFDSSKSVMMFVWDILTSGRCLRAAIE